MKCCMLLIFFVLGSVAEPSFVDTSAKFFKMRKKTVYYLEPEPKYTWQEAATECHQKNMTLLTIQNHAKNTEIKNLLYRIYRGSSTPRFFIGANDLAEFRKFIWTSNGHIVQYTNWYHGEPNNHGDLGERCISIGYYGNEQWNDVDCNYLCGFICEKTLIIKCARC